MARARSRPPVEKWVVVSPVRYRGDDYPVGSFINFDDDEDSQEALRGFIDRNVVERQVFPAAESQESVQDD
jgi:hypothetical protein